MSLVVRALILVFAMCSGACMAAATQPPIESFAMLPVVQSPTLSPDGKSVALLYNTQGATSIVVQNLESADGRKVNLMTTNNRDFTYDWFRWVSSDRLLVSIKFAAKRRNATGSVGGVETSETRLLSVKADGSQVLNLFKPNSFKGEMQAQFQDRVIDFDFDNGKRVLIALAEDPKVGIEPAVYSLDVETGARSHVHGRRDFFHSWIADRSHRVRVGIRREKQDVEIHLCDPDGSNWRKVWYYKLGSANFVEPLGFGKDPNELYVFAKQDGQNGVFSINLREPGLPFNVKLADKRASHASTLVYSLSTGDAIGVRVVSGLKQHELSYWDANGRQLQSAINQALVGRSNQIISTSDDGVRYLVQSTSSTRPGEIYIGDDRANTLKRFAQSYPSLSEVEVPQKRAFQIKTRDGRNLPVLLSLPTEASSKRLPAVVMFPGGAISLSGEQFDIWTAFLVSRGFAVLQVNLRGSQDLARMGSDMPADINDAVRWAVESKNIDGGRICAIGAGDGGYVALMALAKFPDAFRCVATHGAVVDLFELELWEARYANRTRDVFEARDAKDLSQKNSPRYAMPKTQKPVLLVHGTQDRVVPYEQSEIMDAAAESLGNPHRLVKQVGGDHLLSSYENRLEFLSELEQFLFQNLGRP